MTTEWHSLDTNQVLKELNTDLNGLKSDNSLVRLEKYGFNELNAAKKVSPVKIFLMQFKSILILILLGATALSVITGHALDALVIFIIVLFSAIVGFAQEYRAESALEALKNMLSSSALVLRDGKEMEIPARELVPGDIILLKDGDIIPGDARIIQNINLQVNEASLTGESLPVRKQIAKLKKEALIIDRTNMIYSGTGVTYGKAKAVVVATGMNTQFGKIAEQVTTIVKDKTPLEVRTRELGKWFGLIALIICIAIIIIGTIRGFLFIDMLLFAVALAVAAVPEALPAVVTGSLAIGMYKMAKKNALVRKMSAVETLGSITVICSDKTGTLTKGEMTVKKILINSQVIDVSGVGYEPDGEFLFDSDSKILESEHYNLLMYGLLLCNDSELIEKGKEWRVRGDPTEGALVVVATKAGFSHDDIKNKFPRVNELPFSSERKRMATIHSVENGEEIIFMKGAPEVVLNKCNFTYEYDNVKELTENKRNEILKNNNDMANEALRVLAVAFKNLSDKSENFDEETLESNLTFLGLIGMIDPARKEAIEAVRVCNKIKIKPIMITGDHKLTAIAIAKEVGIYHDGDLVLIGDELEKISDKELEEIVESVTVYARVSPTHKLKIVEAWKNRGHVVAMTGDGVNDAPALKSANIGVAMGITGTEVTKEAADLVLTDDNFATIVNAIELGRWTYDNIKKYLTYLLQANLVEIAVLSIAILAGFPLPLLPVHILYINLATDGLPAIALGLSPPDPDLMEKPPMDPKESIFTKDIKSFLLMAIIIEVPLLLLIYILSLPEGVEVARTRLFLVFIFFELVIALNCRSLKHTIFKVKPHKFLLIVVIWEMVLIMILINIPIVREVFGITPIGMFEVWLIIAMCLITLIGIELTKIILNYAERRKAKLAL
jgi:Ca2+-transporting ATPase